jgi:hypothetical protein
MNSGYLILLVNKSPIAVTTIYESINSIGSNR